MEIHLTERAAAEYERISSGAMTPEMASEYLRDGRIQLRTFAESLRDVYPFPDIGRRLTDAFLAFEPESSSEAVAKKVGSWLDGRSRPGHREDVFKIGFALGLNEGDVSHLLGQCTGYGIHYRGAMDVIYTWFLRSGRSYVEAREFYAALPAAGRSSGRGEEPGNVHITFELRNTLMSARTSEELREAYLRNIDLFGRLHLRAYRYFEKYLGLLRRPESGWDGDSAEDYSLDTVMKKYLTLRMPSGRARGGYSVTQKLLKRNWPNATSLKNIRAQREDVPRKLLLLLYVITENVVDGEYSELDEDYLSIGERLRQHWWVLNAILIDCGMPTLDPRNATDWLIMYALTADGNESMSERMSQVIDHLFADM